VDFEDCRIKREQWTELKPTTPFGSMPVLEMDGKPAVSQSNAILSYVGHEHGLLPKDAWETMRLVSLLEACEDVRHAVTKTFGIKDADELKRLRAELAQGPITTWASNLEKQVRGPYASGQEFSVADIKIFIVLNWLNRGALDHIPKDVLDPFPKLIALQKAVAEHPKVQAWYARKS
jgi:glutathione S-transferase